MGDHHRHPAVERILRDRAGEPVADVLSRSLSGADLTSLLLGVMSERAGRRSPAELLAQYERDRFTAPAQVDPRRLLRLCAAVVDALPDGFELVETAPLAPLGTHSVLGGIAQDRIVATVRGTEVAADPTNSLALEAAVRRRQLARADQRSTEVVRLAAVDRIVRAQRFESARSFAHFTLLGLALAGRDVGARGFERAAVLSVLEALVAACSSLGFGRVLLRITELDDGADGTVAFVEDRLGNDQVAVTAWPEREAGRNYYATVCFKIDVEHEDELIEVGDGGDVRWTADLLGNRKERLMIAGLGLERLALL